MGFIIKFILTAVLSWGIYRMVFQESEINYGELLKGKNLVITGASSGVGEEAAKFSAKMGANVVIIARRENLLQQVVAKLNKLSPLPSAKFKYIVADLSDINISETVIKDAERFLGSIDYLLINHAFLPSTQEHFTPWRGNGDQHKALTYALNTNFLSHVKLTDAAIPILKRNNGGLAVVSSAIVDSPAFSLSYATSKGALNTFFTGLNQEFINMNINVSVTIVHLGFVETETSLKTLKYMSERLRHDLETVLKLFPTSKQEEAGKAIVEAMVRRESHFYCPIGQKIWLMRVVRTIVKDPDHFFHSLLVYSEKFVNWKSQYLW